MPTTHSVPGSPAPDQTAADHGHPFPAGDQSQPAPQPTAAYSYPLPAARPRLRRSDSERMLLGVCGGIAEYTDVDPTLVRLAMIGTLFWGGLGVLLYLTAAIVLPRPATS